MPFGGKIMKLSFIILFLSGFILGFKTGFIICFFYSFFHIGKFFYRLSSVDKLFNFNLQDVFLSMLFDYILPDIVISFSGIKQKVLNKNIKDKFYNKSYEIFRILKLMFIISFFRFLFFFTSSYYVYFSKIKSKIDISNKINYFISLFSGDNLLLFCFLYCFIPVFVNFFLSSLFIILFNYRIKNALEKYN